MKYLGSKARLAKYILPIILKNRKTNQLYIEPFAGGLNSFCLVPGPKLASDNNKYLVAMWNYLIKNGTDKLPEISKEMYYNVKNNKNEHPDWLVGWVGFNCSYSGKWFAGYAGKTKTKTGTIRDYQKEAIKNCKNQLKNLSDVTMLCNEYYEINAKDAIIYCDPPYANTTGYASTFDNTAFWDWARRQSKINTVYVSEYKAPNDFVCVWESELKSSLSANGQIGGSKLSTEKLFQFKNTP